MKAYVTVQNFGDDTQKRGLVDTINEATWFHAYLNGDNGSVVMVCRVHELGQLMQELAAQPDLSWIEYTVQFDA